METNVTLFDHQAKWFVGYGDQESAMCEAHVAISNDGSMSLGERIARLHEAAGTHSSGTGEPPRACADESPRAC